MTEDLPELTSFFVLPTRGVGRRRVLACHSHRLSQSRTAPCAPSVLEPSVGLVRFQLAMRGLGRKVLEPVRKICVIFPKLHFLR